MDSVTASVLTIREATREDVPRLVAMWTEFVASSQYERYVGRDPLFCTAAMEKAIESEVATVFVVDRDDLVIGMLGVCVFLQPFSGEVVASELFWWLDPQHRGWGGWLLRRAEKWARERQATRMSMMQPIDKDRVGETYAGLGYSPVELIWQKDL